MQRKISAVLLFLLITILSFSSTVEKVRFNTYPPQIVFDLSADTPHYTVDYDEYNRLLFWISAIREFLVIRMLKTNFQNMWKKYRE